MIKYEHQQELETIINKIMKDKDDSNIKNIISLNEQIKKLNDKIKSLDKDKDDMRSRLWQSDLNIEIIKYYEHKTWIYCIAHEIVDWDSETWESRLVWIDVSEVEKDVKYPLPKEKTKEEIEEELPF